MPHGLACSFTLPLVWKLAAGADAARDAVLAHVFGEAVNEPWKRLAAILEAVGVKTAFSEYGVDAEEARGMIELALGGARGGNFVNPAPCLDGSIAWE